jgi:hypothetical protein
MSFATGQSCDTSGEHRALHQCLPTRQAVEER